jgi:hypothetical protein
VGSCSAESATDPMEKMPHHHTAERQAEFCCIRHPPSDCNLSQSVGADLSSFRACDVSPLTATWNVSSLLAVYPLIVILRDHVDYNAAKLPERLRCLMVVQSPITILRCSIENGDCISHKILNVVTMMLGGGGGSSSLN